MWEDRPISHAKRAKHAERGILNREAGSPCFLASWRETLDPVLTPSPKGVEKY